MTRREVMQHLLRIHWARYCAIQRMVMVRSHDLHFPLLFKDALLSGWQIFCCERVILWSLTYVAEEDALLAITLRRLRYYCETFEDRSPVES